MATSRQECDQIIAAAKESDVKLMNALTRRYYPGSIACKELLATGAIGEPIAAVAYFLKDWGFDRRRPWHKERQRGGGMWLTNGVHIVDGLTTVLDSEIVGVKGAVEQRVFDQQSDDFGFAWFDFRNGTHATAMAYGFRTGVYRDDITVIGTDGFLRCEREVAYLGKAERWEAVDLRSRWPQFDGNYGRNAFHLEWQAFLDSVIHDTLPPISGEYGRHIVAALVAAEHSTATGCEVRLA